MTHVCFVSFNFISANSARLVSLASVWFCFFVDYRGYAHMRTPLTLPRHRSQISRGRASGCAGPVR